MAFHDEEEKTILRTVRRKGALSNTYSTSCKMVFNFPLSYFDVLLLTITTEHKY